MSITMEEVLRLAANSKIADDEVSDSLNLLTANDNEGFSFPDGSMNSSEVVKKIEHFNEQVSHFHNELSRLRPLVYKKFMEETTAKLTKCCGDACNFKD